MAYSFEQIFHTEPKVIGMIEIYSNPVDKTTVRDIEKVVKEIAKSMKINLDNIPSGETLRVFVYPTKHVFYQFFGNEMRRKRSRTAEDMLFIVGEGEIHMVSPKATGMSYTDMIKILVKDILEEYGMEDKVKKAQAKVKEELEPEEIVEEEEEIVEEEPEDEIEEEKIEEPEEITEEEFDDLEKEIDYQIEQSEKPMPEWLDLGWIMYKRQILATTKNKEDFANFIKTKGVKSQNKIQLKQSVLGEYNYASESAAAIVEYIVESYGIRKIFDLIGEPDIKKVIGISEGKFKREYTAWVKKRYVSLKMKQFDKDIIREDKVKEKIEE